MTTTITSSTQSVPLYVCTGSSSSPVPPPKNTTIGKSRFPLSSFQKQTTNKQCRRRFYWTRFFHKRTREEYVSCKTRNVGVLGSPWSDLSSSPCTETNRLFRRERRRKPENWNKFHKRFRSVSQQKKIKRAFNISWCDANERIIFDERAYRRHELQKKKQKRRRRWFTLSFNFVHGSGTRKSGSSPHS